MKKGGDIDWLPKSKGVQNAKSHCLLNLKFETVDVKISNTIRAIACLLIFNVKL